MAEQEPVAEERYRADDARPPLTWAEARTYWLATARPDGRPHLMPLLAVWADGALHFCADATTRKGRNLARDARCVIAAGDDALDLVLEGEAAKVRDEGALRRVAVAYVSKYGWQVVVRDGAFYADGAPTAGPPPYEVYAVRPTAAFGFGTDDSLGATRWRF